MPRRPGQSVFNLISVEGFIYLAKYQVRDPSSIPRRSSPGSASSALRRAGLTMIPVTYFSVGKKIVDNGSIF